MKNKFFLIISVLTLFFLKLSISYSDELNIKSTSVSVDKKTQILILKGNVSVEDKKNNKIFTEFAKYNKAEQFLETEGETEIITSEGFKISGTNFTLDNKKRIISSEYQTLLLDKDGNKINVGMFNYVIDKNLFFSKGNINVEDVNKNIYNFSEIYIDEKKKKIVGSDVRLFLNQKDLKFNDSNEPRIFANSVNISGDLSKMDKGIFTFCKNRGEDKCPPWTLQSKLIEHSSSKKTIYYKNAVLKV
ncbi:MAG: LPS export ABC transporter periplasmic protein LptC, partial [Pelagibacteraceae bacterium]